MRSGIAKYKPAPLSFGASFGVSYVPLALWVKTNGLSVPHTVGRGAISSPDVASIAGVGPSGTPETGSLWYSGLIAERESLGAFRDVVFAIIATFGVSPKVMVRCPLDILFT